MDAVIIPAYNPDQILVELVGKLQRYDLLHIIVVNDGSGTQSDKVFRQIAKGVILLEHRINRGKGAAIKTALEYMNHNQSDIKGIVILDADGQHQAEDALRLLNHLHENDTGFVLGVRDFKAQMPWRSLFGNVIIRYIFRLCSGIWISDTQTGLRAFSPDLIQMLLNVKGDRYEYEMNALLACVKNHISVTEVPIATIYHDESNSCSHFRTIRDSVRILANILAFSGASFLSFLLDYLLFIQFVRLFGGFFLEGTALVTANISARIFSAAFNYYLNSTFVFKHRQNRKKSIVRYALLAGFILILNSILLYALHDLLEIKKTLAKIITEATLFCISFVIQRFVIFSKKRKQ